MKNLERLVRLSLILLLLSAGGQRAWAQRSQSDDEFGPVVRAYLGYLRNEQEVVDDRVSRREISAAYYRRNSNRIRALRQMALQIARSSRNDYLPELEAVTRDEMGDLFEKPPVPSALRVGAVLNNTFRFLGVVRSVDLFYVFARLDPYEQQELIGKEKGRSNGAAASPSAGAPVRGEQDSRPRHVGTP